MSHPIQIFSTKKLPAALVAALKLRDDLIYVEANFIQITPVLLSPDQTNISSINKDTAVVFTSGNAVRYAKNYCSDPSIIEASVFCLEGQTQKLAREIFCKAEIVATASDAVALAAKIIDLKIYKKVLFFCGNIRRNDLPELLQQHGIEVQEIVVYDTVLVPQKIAFIPDAVLFFSPSAVESFLTLNSISAHTVCFAIGATTAAAIQKNHQVQKIITAAHHSPEALLDNLFKHFQLINIEPFNQ